MADGHLVYHLLSTPALISGLQGGLVFNGRVPAAAMKKLLLGDTMERTWAGHRNSTGSICLVNTSTGEGAWTGTTQTVCLSGVPFPVFTPHLQLQHGLSHRTYVACSKAWVPASDDAM